MNILTTKNPRLSVTLSISVILSGCSLQAIEPTSPDSSYACQTATFAGQWTEGDGPYGCYFQLRDPATRKLLARTTYQLTVYASAKKTARVFDVESVTDAQGRSLFVRMPFPITPDKIRFVQTIGKGNNGRSGVLIRPTDGAGVPFNPYRISGCGQTYEGVTDETGQTVLVKCETIEKLHVEFYSRDR